MAPTMRGNVMPRTEAQKRFVATAHALLSKSTLRVQMEGGMMNVHPHLSMGERKDFSRVGEWNWAFAG